MIYLDHNATTPLDPRVREAMLPYLQDLYGNASSRHGFGRLARAGLDTAREQVAELVGVHSSQVLFTSGGTESNNLALKGIAVRGTPGRIAISAVEHASLRGAAQALEGCGWRVDALAVDAEGRLEPSSLDHALRDDTRLVSVMMANNETGVLQNIAQIAERARQDGVLCHTDAVQAAGKVDVDFAGSGVHLMSLSAHKLYGPKGVGALIVDSAVEIEPLLPGGGQERGLRAGTENIPGIVGFGEAAELARKELGQRRARLLQLRQRLEQGLRVLPGVTVFAAAAPRLPNTVMFGAAGVDGETLVMQLDRSGIAVSSGSACASTSTEPNPVLLAMGVAPALARGAVRVSLGKDNTEADVMALLGALRASLAELRGALLRATGS